MSKLYDKEMMIENVLDEVLRIGPKLKKDENIDLYVAVSEVMKKGATKEYLKRLLVNLEKVQV